MIPERLTAADGLFETISAVNALIDWAQVQGAGQENTALGIVAIWTDLPAHPTKTYRLRTIDNIDTVIIHHVGVPGEVTAKSIARYHIRKHDWPGIGYHYYILQDGTVQQTQPLDRISNHCGNRACNEVGIGVCLQGHFMKDVRPTPAQLISCRLLNEHIAKILERDVWNISYLGHKEVVQTACPGDTWPLWRSLVVPAEAA